MKKGITHTLIAFLIGSFIVSCSSSRGESQLTEDATTTNNFSVSEKSELIFHWLQNTSELKMHQMRGAVNNTMFLSKDGHKEAVFDGNKKIVNDQINNGSYNYAHPVKDPLNHFNKDIFPWIKWGYSKEDPTTKKERILALSQALGSGLSAAQAKPKNSKPYSSFSSTEKSVTNTFIQILKKGKIEEVYEILKNPQYKPKNPYNIGKGLDKGLQKTL